MRGSPTGRKANISFKVRWAGLPESKDTWLSWKDGKDCTAVQLFLYYNTVDAIRNLVKPTFLPGAVGVDDFHRRPEEKDD